MSYKDLAEELERDPEFRRLCFWLWGKSKEFRSKFIKRLAALAGYKY